MAEAQPKQKKTKERMDPLVASLMPESDKKMAGIAGISLVVAFFSLKFSTLYILSNSSLIIKSNSASKGRYFNSLSLVYTLYNFCFGLMA